MSDSTDPATLIATAQARATQTGLPYTGALLPKEALSLLQQLPQATLVDVRTRAEWEWVGRYPGAVFIEWNTWPGGEPNPDFLDQLRASVPDLNAPVMFLCRSGARSSNAAAAAARAGYQQAFNVLQGFEGDKDQQGHRNTLGGWRACGLPWVQG